MRFLHLSLDGQVVSTERYLRAVLSRATVVAEAINTTHEKVTNSYTTQGGKCHRNEPCVVAGWLCQAR